MTIRAGAVLRRAEQADEAFLDSALRRYSSEIALHSSAVDAERGLEPAWLTDPRLHPFVIVERERAAGFALVMGPEYAASQSEAVDRLVYDFWVDPGSRGSGLARRAALALFAHGSGSWAIPVLPSNLRALAFWRTALAARGTGWSLARGHEGLSTYRFRV